MQTCQSPRTVMGLAHEVATFVLPVYASRFSRHDFTLAQLFACLVVREQLKLSFRRCECLLRDTDWCQRIDMTRTPDHATLHRAHRQLIQHLSMQAFLDNTMDLMSQRASHIVAIDSTMYDTHHHSRYYEKRCAKQRPMHDEPANHRRSVQARRMPKLAIGVDVKTHMIPAMLVRTGMGSDALDFDSLLRQSNRRMEVHATLADAGYDSQHNHPLARDTLGIASWIKATAGRPGSKPASNAHRRHMQRMLAGSQKGKLYGQRAQVETVMSMLKRNLGDHLRCRIPEAREREMLLKVITHNLMIIHWQRGSRQSRSDPVSIPEAAVEDGIWS